MEKRPYAPRVPKPVREEIYRRYLNRKNDKSTYRSLGKEFNLSYPAIFKIVKRCANLGDVPKAETKVEQEQEISDVDNYGEYQMEEEHLQDTEVFSFLFISQDLFNSKYI